MNDSATGFHDSNGDGDRERVKEIVLQRMKTECGGRCTSSGTTGGQGTVALVAGAAGAAGGGAEEKE